MARTQRLAPTSKLARDSREPSHAHLVEHLSRRAERHHQHQHRRPRAQYVSRRTRHAYLSSQPQYELRTCEYARVLTGYVPTYPCAPLPHAHSPVDPLNGSSRRSAASTTSERDAVHREGHARQFVSRTARRCNTGPRFVIRAIEAAPRHAACSGRPRTHDSEQRGGERCYHEVCLGAYELIRMRTRARDFGVLA
eukprot:6202861-Pleurochrysis_carterae.AAC.2